MNRISHQFYAEVISEGLNAIPTRFTSMVGDFDVLTGVNPVLVGLHPGDTFFDDRSPEFTAHIAYSWNQTYRNQVDRRHTMVLPTKNIWSPWVIVHEFGHLLHAVVDIQLNLDSVISDYAKVNKWEQFAEALCAYIDPLYADYPLSYDARQWFDHLGRS